MNMMFSALGGETFIDDDDDENGGTQQQTRQKKGDIFNTCLRVGNAGCLALLTCTTAVMFIQIQALALRVSSTQQQIDDLTSSLQSSQQDIEAKVEQQLDFTVINLAGMFVLLTCLLSFYHMSSHLRNMHQPVIQRKILSILWMPVIYALTSFFSLIWTSAEHYLGIVRDFYESFVIYQFLSFLIAVLGRGNREVVVKTLARHAHHLRKPYKFLYCIFHPRPEESDEAMANAVLLECQVLAMQFVFFRPFTAIVSFVLGSTGVGQGSQGSYSFFYSPQFFVLLLENVSVFFAFSGLLKFYHVVSEDLAWMQPFAKFLTIKGVVFMTFWQGLAINILFNGLSGSGEDESNSSRYTAQSIQQILICMEMLGFSIAHSCVFPAEEWEPGYKRKFYDTFAGFGFRDFASDVAQVVESSKLSVKARRHGSPSFGTADDSDSSVVQSNEDDQLVV
mmetsp:Transcript_27720/g.62136  ORF Transcript_27720/g.62136 Transcript_27720/m.62136 type:complete len:449 (-) Transcript_27720:1281-2627(-)